MQGAYADAVAREQHLALLDINQHEGKLALQMMKQILAVLLIEMDDDLGVGARAEHMAFSLETCL